MRILIAEHQAEFLRILSELCRLWGHEARGLQHPVLTISTALDFRPDVVMLDIGMAEIDAREIARQMRRQRRLEGTLLIALADPGLEHERTGHLEAGFDAFLVKPLNFQELKGLLQSGVSAKSRSSILVEV
jgi:Response regulators consisting of a CheY-like receiver domain and a winged-helix DNA-binding domain